MKTNYSSRLENIISNKNATVGIFGMGYVGMPLSLRFSEVGYKVIGFDIDEKKIGFLNKGNSYIKHISSKQIKKMLSSGFEASSDFRKVKNCDALVICVPTPLNKNKEPDLTYVNQTLELMLPYLKKGQILSLESTTYPGTSEEIIYPKVTTKGFKVGKDFFLIYSPEREDPGNLDYETSSIPKIVGGYSKSCVSLGIALYSNAINKIVGVSDTRTAEMVKLLENIHRAVNIGLVNEMKILTDRMGLDIFEIIDAASTKPFGFTPYYPGPGLGGHCIPIDPFYLTWKAKEFGLHTRFIELAGEINESMPFFVLDKINSALNKIGISISKAKILVIGIAYKKNVEDPRESPSIKIMDLLRNAGAEVSYHDPFIPNFPEMKKYKFNLKSLELTKKNLKEQSLVLVATDHDQIDYDFILNQSKLIVDSRGVYKNKSKKIIKA